MEFGLDLGLGLDPGLVFWVIGKSGLGFGLHLRRVGGKAMLGSGLEIGPGVGERTGNGI